MLHGWCARAKVKTESPPSDEAFFYYFRPLAHRDAHTHELRGASWGVMWLTWGQSGSITGQGYPLRSSSPFLEGLILSCGWMDWTRQILCKTVHPKRDPMPIWEQKIWVPYETIARRVEPRRFVLSHQKPPSAQRFPVQHILYNVRPTANLHAFTP